MFKFIVNNREVSLNVPAGKILLDVLRGDLNLTGVKEGCREGDCGACMVLVGEKRKGAVLYRPANSCLIPVGDAAGKHVVTIEGINGAGFTPVQNAILEEGATQCGFCTPGIVVSLTAFLLNAKNPSEKEAVEYIAGNICRCTGYASIKRAVKKICDSFDAGEFTGSSGGADRIKTLMKLGVLPGYFKEIPARLGRLKNSRSPAAHNSVVVAGGTDLFAQNAGKLKSADLNFLSLRKDFQGIRTEKNYCVIGAAASTEDIKNSPVMRKCVPGIEESLLRVSAVPIRFRATAGGNIINASPIGDLAVIFLALDAKVLLSKGKRKRGVPLRKFFTGYKKLDLKEGEIAEAICFVPSVKGALFNFEKVAKRPRLDIASVNSAIRLEMKKDKILAAHVSAGGVAPVPLYLEKTSKFLAGKKIDQKIVREAAETALSEIKPISDVRGSKEYKRILLKQLIFAHFIKLFPDKVGEKNFV